MSRFITATSSAFRRAVSFRLRPGAVDRYRPDPAALNVGGTTTERIRVELETFTGRTELDAVIDCA
jgi:hypothetical protein